MKQCHRISGVCSMSRLNIFSYCTIGYEGFPVEVECDISRGLPAFSIVGLAGSAVQESRQRVAAALQASGFELPSRKILINLSPGGLPKDGAAFDCAIALAILLSSSQIRVPAAHTKSVSRIMLLGELGLKGKIRSTERDCAALLSLGTGEFDKVIVSHELISAASSLPLDHIRLDFPENLRSMINLLCVENKPRAPSTKNMLQCEVPQSYADPRNPDSESSDGTPFPPAVRGEVLAKLALCAAGNHNILFYGPPGSGKTSSVRALELLLPEQRGDMLREQYRIHSRHPSVTNSISQISGLKLYREPHHGSSAEGVLGGGKHLVPGELALAHGGVLVLDEAPEFHRNVLQSLREPMEQAGIRLIRASMSTVYPCRTVFAFTMNLCPCGNRGRSDALCLCSPAEIARYWSRMGGALYDRIEIRHCMASGGEPTASPHSEWRAEQDPELSVLSGLIDRHCFGSPVVLRQCIERSRQTQLLRYRGGGARTNAYAQVSDLDEQCQTDESARDLITQLLSSGFFSNRQIINIRRLSLTLHDIEAAIKTGSADAEEKAKARIQGRHIRDAAYCMNPGRYDEYL